MIVALVFIIYSNTLHSPWILDDFHTIVDNPRIQVTRLSFQSIKNSFFSNAGNSEMLYRPLSCVSFALNAFISGKKVAGYHLFNITLHAATSLVLMWLLLLVFRTPALEKLPDREKHFVIILSTLLWSVHPIQIQAVTYIVQRMAAMCAFFVLMALGFYIKARLAESFREKWSYGLCCTTVILCAFFSKENGLIALPLMLALEFLLFQNGSFNFFLNRTFLLCLAVACLISLLLVFHSTSFSQIESLYAKRPFTLYERLLTQPKILLYYLSLIFYPLPSRFSLEHELIISSGIFSPPLTFFYLVAVVSSFFACVFFRKIPLLIRLGVLFFFVGHAIESSALPLEMTFEHRNYLPSTFIFPPIAAGLYRIIYYYQSSSKAMAGVIFVFTTSIIFLTSMGTYTRNFDWRSGESLWRDAMEKAPGHARPKQSMGFVIGMRNPGKALNYYFEALSGYMHDPKEEKASILANIALIYFHQNNYEKAQYFFNLAIETDNNHWISHYFLIQTHMKKGEWAKAISIIENKRNPPNLMNLKAICFLRMGDYGQALNIFRNIYMNNRNDKNALMGIAEALSLSGCYQRADFFYRRYLDQNPDENGIVAAYLGISKNSYLNKNFEKSILFLNRFFKLTGAENAGPHIQRLGKDIFSPLTGIETMFYFIENEFENYKKNLTLRLPEKNQSFLKALNSSQPEQMIHNH